MAISGFGKAKYGGGGFGNQWKPKEGDNLIRILPPMHSFAESGKWANYVGIHFGYCGVDPTDPTKQKQRPFKCVEKKQRGGLVEQECPACNEIASTTAEMKATEAELIKAGKSEEEIKTVLSSYVNWLKTHNVDRKHYLNVMIPSGEVGFFTISHKTKKALDEKLKEVSEKENIDALDPDDGLWLNVKRVGKMLQAVDTIELVYEDVKVDGRTYKSIKRAPLSEAEATKALAECKDLANVGTELSVAQVQALVDSGGDADEVDKVFGGQRAASAESAPKAPSAPAAAPKAPSKPVEAPAAPAAVTKPALDPAIAERLAAIKAKKAAEEEAKRKAAEAAAAVENVDASGLSDEAFLLQFDTGS